MGPVPVCSSLASPPASDAMMAKEQLEMVKAAQTQVKRVDGNDASDDKEEENNNVVAEMKEEDDENLEDFQPKKDVKCRCIELLVENYELKELHRELIEDRDESKKSV